MRINHNIAALNTYRQLTSASGAQSKSMEKLSSGLRINRAGDDAAGLAISEKMRGQIRGLEQAQRNSQDGISLLQTAEGALNETHSILQRMRELATQAANDTNTADDRKEIQKEINQLTSEVNRIGNTTEFNTKKLLNAGVDNAEALDNVVKGLKESGWLEVAEEKIKELYGLQGKGNQADGTASKLHVIFEGGTEYGTLAFVTSNTGNTNQKLTIDLSDFKPGDGENGNNGLGKGFYNDRIIAHEMTHAVMNDAFGAANAHEMQEWFLEGSAEFIPGGDERLKQVIGKSDQSGVDSTKLTDFLDRASDLLSGTAEWKGDNTDYAAGYVIMKYAQKNLDSGKDFKSLMADIQTNLTNGDKGSIAVEKAIASNTTFASFADFKTGFDKTDNTGAKHYIENSITLNWGSDEADTGSIGGSNHGGSALTPEAVINNSAADDKTDGQPLQHFEVVWPESVTSNVTLQVGANKGQSFTIQLQDMRSKSLTISGGAGEEVLAKDGVTKAYFTAIDPTDSSMGVTNGTESGITEYALDVSTHEKATAAIQMYDDAIAKVSSFRSELGAAQNRLEHTINNLGTSAENLTAAESRIRDVDYALVA